MLGKLSLCRYVRACFFYSLTILIYYFISYQNAVFFYQTRKSVVETRGSKHVHVSCDSFKLHVHHTLLQTGTSCLVDRSCPFVRSHIFASSSIFLVTIYVPYRIAFRFED